MWLALAESSAVIYLHFAHCILFALSILHLTNINKYWIFIVPQDRISMFIKHVHNINPRINSCICAIFYISTFTFPSEFMANNCIKDTLTHTHISKNYTHITVPVAKHIYLYTQTVLWTHLLTQFKSTTHFKPEKLSWSQAVCKCNQNRAVWPESTF